MPVREGRSDWGLVAEQACKCRNDGRNVRRLRVTRYFRVHLFDVVIISGDENERDTTPDQGVSDGKRDFPAQVDIEERGIHLGPFDHLKSFTNRGYGANRNRARCFQFIHDFDSRIGSSSAMRMRRDDKLAGLGASASTT